MGEPGVAGDRLLVSGPDVRRGTGPHGVQWAPEAARSVLVAGDEAALPAVRGIVAALGSAVRARVLVAAADPADAVLGAGEHVEVERVEALLPALARERGAEYAWVSAESGDIAEARRVLAAAGVPRIQAQGYWKRGGRRG
ncbi:SIP domain-containing protein [Pseudonocardia pini]|uniref:SIP domain-containing protein n=1 Tax=Pseudonocardia pini TaxID=2758030 RepID=UPI001C68F3BA|nr:SIP domain-containing protein [Pseudonocardia pini]